MTMPIERARSLRWGWEFLCELRTAPNLTAEQLGKVEAILQHYPSTREIREWATAMQGRVDCVPWLEVEDDRDDAQPSHSGLPQEAVRGPTTPAQRWQALVAAGQFFHIELRTCCNLTAEQSRILRYVCRHYPQGADIAALSADNWNCEESKRRRILEACPFDNEK